MKKRFIITESERNQIRKMYGLIKEGREQIQEIETYTLEYIQKDGCGGMKEDIQNLHAAVQRGEVNLSQSAKSSLEENIKMAGLINAFCNKAKNQLTETLKQNISDESQYPDMIATGCWMSKNSQRHQKSLSICNQTQDQNNNQNNNQNINQNINQNNQFQNQNINSNLSNNDVDLSTMRDYNQTNTQNQNTIVQKSELDDFIRARGGSKSSGRTLDLK